MEWLLAGGILAALVALSGGGSGRSRVQSRAPRGRVELGEVRTTADIQGERLGIGPDLFRELVRTVNGRAFRARPEYRSITGPVQRIEAWLADVRDLRAHDLADALAREGEWMRAHGAPLAAAYATLSTSATS